MFGKSGDETYVALLLKAGDNMLHAAHEFRAALTGEGRPAERFAKIDEYERIGDELVQRIFVGLNSIQTSPIPREALLQLAGCIDDVLDGIEASMARFDYLEVDYADKVMQQFSVHIVSCCHHLVEALKLLANKKYLQIREHTVEINRIEHEADLLMREGIRAIFRAKKDPYHDMKLKEIYERLEETTDRCEDAADVLQGIILKLS
ncbi:DUF47 domain-containing protein [Cohnella sp.]|uniref:DUF47 domain-containing protein n=1 Tax=Cohnella sp. TaxID=1883426 RepID=UPI00356561E7